MSKTQEDSTEVGVSTTNKFPQVPSEYRPEPLFLQKKRDLEISGEIIRDVISNGIKLNRDGYEISFQKRVGGFLWEFVVEYNHNGKNDLVNAYRSW